jgi:hypothetical protein
VKRPTAEPDVQKTPPSLWIGLQDDLPSLGDLVVEGEMASEVNKFFPSPECLKYLRETKAKVCYFLVMALSVM